MPLEALTESPADAAEALAVESGSVPNPSPEPAPQPAPEAAPAPEAKTPAEAPKEPAAAPPKPPGFVPNQAIREAREEARLLREELNALKAGRQPEPPRQEIDPETDPIAALKEIRDWQQRQVAQAHEHQALQQFDNQVRTHEAEWVAADPDYGDKVSFLHDFRARQLKALGANEQQIALQLAHEARQVAATALQRGMNPGEMFSTLAVEMGWKGKAPAPAAAAPVAPEPAPDIEAKRAESNAALERIARGQRASRPTAGAGGNAPESEMTLESLSKLNGAAFDAAMDKYGKQLFGG